MPLPQDLFSLTEKAVKVLEEVFTTAAPSEQQLKQAELAARVVESYAQVFRALHGAR